MIHVTDSKVKEATQNCLIPVTDLYMYHMLIILEGFTLLCMYFLAHSMTVTMQTGKYDQLQ